MKLNKNTRKALYEAAPKTTEITWPQDAPEPSWGHRYPVYTEEGNYAFTVRLEGSHKGPYETKATVRIDSDPTRVLPGLKGVRTDAGDYETEPERVDRAFEDELAMTARYGSRVRRAERRPVERQVELEGELQEARSSGQSGRTRKLEAKLSQHHRRTEDTQAVLPPQQAA